MVEKLGDHKVNALLRDLHNNTLNNWHQRKVTMIDYLN